jgi:hypothetical protein
MGKTLRSISAQSYGASEYMIRALWTQDERSIRTDISAQWIDGPNILGRQPQRDQNQHKA